MSQASHPGRSWLRVGIKLRRLARFMLGAVLVVGGLLAWQLTGTLQGQAGDMIRYVRVDAASTDLTGDEIEAFLITLALHVAGRAETTFADVERQLARLRGAIALLRSNEGDQEPHAFGDVDGTRAKVAAAVTAVGGLLANRTDARNDQTLYLTVAARLAPARTSLRQLSDDLAHVRIQLQDRDLANVQRLIALNRDMLLIFFAVATAFVALLLVEARAAARAERTARKNERRFKEFADVASDWLWETDVDQQFTYLSTATIAGAPPPKGFLELAGRPDQGGLKSYLEATAERRPFRDFVYQTASLGGDEPQTMRVSGRPMFDDRGAFLGYRGAGTDITAEVQREAQIRFLARHDQLTNLPNRTAFHDRLGTVLARAGSTGAGGALLALDLDGFKEVNDVFGHDVGDTLLVAATKRLSGIVASQDTLARLGGDEFAIVQTELTHALDATRSLAERVIEAITEPFQVAGKEIRVGVSIGVALFPTDGATPEEIMKAADLALYSAKAAGRGCFRYFHADMGAELRERKQLEGDLREAIAAGDLQIFLQPQVGLVDGGLVGAEALVRWHHAELGWVPPSQFVPIAEGCGLILPLGQLMLESACQTAATWTGAAADAVVAVNVSPAQFTLSNLAEDVAAVLQRSGLPPHRLELEVTEGVLMRDEQAAIATLERLRAIGIQLAIDDFGTGYSSLRYLQRFPVHKVKIDKSFVDGLATSQDDRMIAKAIVMLGQALSLKTIAEGIETVAQSEYLTTLGCDHGQGYLFGRPLPSADFARTYDRIKPVLALGA